MVLNNYIKKTEMDYLYEQAALWLKWDKTPETRKEIEDLVASKNEEELKKRFCKRIEFGTAGLRGKMCAGFNCMNNLIVQQASQGLALAVEELVQNAHEKGVVIGYDGRYHSKEFAAITAKVFISKGFKTYLFSTLCPTPWTAFAVGYLKTACGVMVTASHNPKADNGYKVYWENGCQIIEPIDANIASKIHSNLEPWDLSNVDISKVIDPLADVSAEYYKQMMLTIPHFECPEQPKVKYVYTAMHGVGSKYVQDAFKTAKLPQPILVPLQNEPDPEFPTVPFPNPEEGKGALKCSIEVAEANGATVIIANDPDADRLSVAVKSGNGWRQFTGNEMSNLIADWTYNKYVASGDKTPAFMVRSTVSSSFISKMGEVEGFDTYETLTGFKWIGNKAKEIVDTQHKKLLMAYEEAIGFVIGNMSYDKDGVRAAVCFAAMALEYAEQGFNLEDRLNMLYEKYGYFASNNKYYFCYDPKLMEKIFNKMRNNGQYYWKFGKYAVKSIRDLTVGIDTAQPDKKPLLPVSASTQMITYTFENGCKATLRGSGTEPKLKYYIELPGKKGVKPEDVIAELMDLSHELLQASLEPEKNGLIPPKAE
ncbi:phosphoglucomutase/phosphomannomutase family protein [Entamoeba nuttalli P19]|uniref:Phosphoglucomutase/phosphomannomutase family protein n=2 Tax=Entamoeba nuttalli TaxID=412467 RepID=K2GJN3_ENTNP|nr:phosphoglucomutase/phosphomannomutase family protein [Entamoeba nuttalli P19]EKE43006.1 phosphoglucomutase/phosphomannomutase family protein [Entamoeba nuttalli P19]|eukprot:XP_008854659.1 phosphoglucomutase/phosphomannomutase family protein [Entamoeba nuttalli P19]